MHSFPVMIQAAIARSGAAGFSQLFALFGWLQSQAISILTRTSSMHGIYQLGLRDNYIGRTALCRTSGFVLGATSRLREHVAAWRILWAVPKKILGFECYLTLKRADGKRFFFFSIDIVEDSQVSFMESAYINFSKPRANYARYGDHLPPQRGRRYVSVREVPRSRARRSEKRSTHCQLLREQNGCPAFNERCIKVLFVKSIRLDLVRKSNAFAKQALRQPLARLHIHSLSLDFVCSPAASCVDIYDPRRIALFMKYAFQ